MFVVIGLFQLFLWLGKPNGGASVMFALVLIILGWMGAWVARYFSEPMNRLLRNR